MEEQSSQGGSKEAGIGTLEVDIEEIFSGLDQAHGDRGLTSREVAKSTGWGLGKVRKMLRQGVEAGRIVIGSRYVPNDWDGKARHYTTYIPVE